MPVTLHGWRIQTACNVGVRSGLSSNGWAVVKELSTASETLKKALSHFVHAELDHRMRMRVPSLNKAGRPARTSRSAAFDEQRNGLDYAA